MTPPIVTRFLIALDQYKLIGMFIFGLIFLGSGVFALQQPKPQQQPSVYQARGDLYFKPQPTPSFTNLGQQLQEQGVGIINQDLLLSPAVITRVIAQLKSKGFNITEEDINKLIEDKQLQLTLPKAEEAKIITVQYLDNQEKRAQLLIQVFLEQMVKESELLNSSQLRTKIAALQKRVVEIQDELKQAEGKLYSYIGTEGSALLAIQDGSLFTAITANQEQQRQLKIAIEGVDGEIGSLSNQLGLTPDQAYTSSALSSDPIIASLRAQLLQIESQISLLGRDLRPEHPKMVELFKQKSANEQLLRERASEVIGKDGILTPLPSQIRKESNLDPARQELANRLVALKSQKESLLKQLESVRKTEEELRREYERFPEKQIIQSQLAQEVQNKRSLYQNIVASLVDAQSAEAEIVSNLEIARPPLVQEVKPEIKQPVSTVVILAAGAGAGVLMAIGVIFLLAVLDSRLHTAQEIKAILGEREVPLLGEVPYIFSYDADGKETGIIVETNSVYLPFYERFRSNVRRFSAEDTRVILVTSISEQEGKSISGYNLAIASANAGKRTLLIEANLRNGSQAPTVNITLDPLASVEPLNYYASTSDCIRLVPEIYNLYVVPSPGPQQQAAAIIESNELKRLINDSRQRFDLVIVDTPSLSRCNDALLLEPLTDGIILVTRPGITQGNLLTETLEQFEDAEINLIGVAINAIIEQSIAVPKPPKMPLKPKIKYQEDTENSEEASKDYSTR